MKFFGNFGRRIGGFLSAFRLKYHTKFNRIAEGEIFVKIKENGQLVESRSLGKNIVVLEASVLLARLMKNPSDPIAGVGYFALGTGNPAWDLLNPPPPVDTATTLIAEIERVAPTSSTFINPADGLASATPTNIVDWDFDFADSEAVGPLMEAALFGGDATLTADSGSMITWKTFPVISKTNTMTISFTYRLTF